jgi:cytochrome c oxidase cbb3-type subunit 3
MSSRSALAFFVLFSTACWREERELSPPSAEGDLTADPARQTSLQAGGFVPAPTVVNPYEGNAYAISEGQRLYGQFNCVGCHANGGGGMGPPLIDAEWVYGSEPANVFDTLMKGRPNGMPAWSGRIPDEQAWQLVTYVRSLSDLEPKSATPPRTDAIEEKSFAPPPPSRNP